MKTRLLLLACFALTACPETNPVGVDDGGSPLVPADAAVTCTPAQCAAELAASSVSPAGCANVACDQASGQCVFTARDGDGDGELAACSVSGRALSGTDCDDNNPQAHTETWFRDLDGDGAGTAQDTVRACVQPSGYVRTADDCNDSLDGGASIHPGGAEVCTSEGVDEDCDGTVDEGCGCPMVGLTQACCGGRSIAHCEALDGGATQWGACDAVVATESCNGIDDDCDGTVDGNDPSLCPIANQRCVAGACACPTGQVLCGTQCVTLPTNSCSVGVGYCQRTGSYVCRNGAVACSVDPGQPRTEISCNGIDDNCNGNSDETASAPQYWADCDGDGYGNGSTATRSCTRPARCGGHSDATNPDDCNDSAANVNPAASGSAQCGSDLDCDGNAYENVTCTANATTVCYECPALTATISTPGQQVCSGSCSWGSCVTSAQVVFTPPRTPFALSTIFGYPLCSGTSVSSGAQGNEFDKSYQSAGSADCAFLKSDTIRVAAGTYTFSFDHYDYANLVTPRILVVVRDENSVAVTSGVFSNLNAGWEAKSLAFTVPNCHRLTIEFIELATSYQGGTYVGGDRVGHFRMVKL
ncbi:MAG: MopE-related protein [Archangium sp.]